MPSADDIIRWSRPDGILLPREFGRLNEFLEVFLEQLGRLAEDPENPDMVEVVCARRCAAAVWGFDRTTDDADELERRVEGNVSRQMARQEQFAESDLRQRLSTTYLRHVQQAELLLQACRSEGSAVVPVMLTRKRRA